MAPDATFTVRGGHIVLPDRIIEADMAVREGRIAALTPWSEGMAQGDVDARGLIVMAGMIDPHVHMRDPDPLGFDDFPTCTAAAAVGGVTTVFDMPNTVPAIADADTLLAKRDHLSTRAHVDFALYGGAGAGNIAAIAEQAEAGAIAFKSFMNAPTSAQGEAGWSRCLPDAMSMLAAMQALAKTGRIGVLHAENEALCLGLAAEAMARGENTAADHALSRPPVAEEEAVSRALVLSRQAGSRVSFAHVSTRGALSHIARAKADGQSVTAEATPHHLLRDDSAFATLGPYAKINPPLRSAADRDAVWAALSSGVIDFIGSDHAPYSLDSKEAGWSDIWKAPSGGHGVETVFPVLLGEAMAGRLTLPRLTALLSHNVARLFGLADRKGVLQPGRDADFVLIDPRAAKRVECARLHSLTREAARLWDGWNLPASIVATYLRGVEIARDGEIVATERHGRFLAPDTAT